MSERPKHLTHEIAMKVASELVDRLIKSGELDPKQRDQSISDVAGCGDLYRDGYELAKRLEDRRGWDCDFAIAEVLNDFACDSSHEIDQAQKAWAEETKPQPPLPIGTAIKLRNEVGVIAGIYEHGAAQYKVRVDTDRPNSHRIINFEDAAAA